MLSGLDQVTIDDSSAVAGVGAACGADIERATAFIRRQAEHDAGMTDVISKIKTHLRVKGTSAPDDAFLQDLADVEGIDVDLVRKYDKFRKSIAAFRSTQALPRAGPRFDTTRIHDPGVARESDVRQA